MNALVEQICGLQEAGMLPDYKIESVPERTDEIQRLSDASGWCLHGEQGLRMWENYTRLGKFYLMYQNNRPLAMIWLGNNGKDSVVHGCANVERQGREDSDRMKFRGWPS